MKVLIAALPLAALISVPAFAAPANTARVFPGDGFLRDGVVVCWHGSGSCAY